MNLHDVCERILDMIQVNHGYHREHYQQFITNTCRRMTRLQQKPHATDFDHFTNSLKGRDL